MLQRPCFWVERLAALALGAHLSCVYAERDLYIINVYEPDRSITRAEFAAVVVRAFGLQRGTTESGFGDVTLPDWFND